jgi:DNA-binding transcriptional MerR regulator
MRIGDVAERTGVAARMIRYYESQGLLDPDRGDNGYRIYSEHHVERVLRIRNHIDAGVPTRLIRIVFEMEDPTWTEECSRDFAVMLGEELAALDERISCLRASRDSLDEFLANVRIAAR